MDARAKDPGSGEGRAGEGGTPLLVLDGFNGPLELLLSLAREQQIDLARLSVADLVEQLAAALQEAGPSLGEKGNWVVMACWLLLRSHLLLAADAPAQHEAEETADELRARLLDLQAARALASWLERSASAGRAGGWMLRPRQAGMGDLPASGRILFARPVVGWRFLDLERSAKQLTDGPLRSLATVGRDHRDELVQ